MQEHAEPIDREGPSGAGIGEEVGFQRGIDEIVDHGATAQTTIVHLDLALTVHAQRGCVHDGADIAQGIIDPGPGEKFDLCAKLIAQGFGAGACAVGKDDARNAGL